MTVFESYFVPVDTEAEKYTVEANGLLVVNRLINTQADCWLSLSQERDLRPKHLVLSDWTLADKPLDYIKALYKKLYILLSPPYRFQISWYQDGKISPLTKKTLYNLYYQENRKAIKPVSDDAIKKLMAEKDVSQKEVFIFTPHEIRCLLKNEQTAEVIYISDLYHSSFSLEEILKSLDKKRRYIFHFGEYNAYIRRWFNENKERLKEYGDFILDIYELNIAASKYTIKEWLLDENIENEKKIAKTSRVSIESLLLETEEETSFYGSERFQIGNVLSRYRALTELSLSFIDFSKYDTSLRSKVDNSVLKKLEIDSSELSTTDMLDLMRISKTLESLKLSVIHIKPTKVKKQQVVNSDKESDGWDTIKALFLDRVFLESKDILTYLEGRVKACSQIESLCIHNNIARNESPEKNKHHNMILLELTDMFVKRASQSLSTIDLDGIADVLFLMSEPNYHYPNLKVLKINQCQSDIDNSLSLSSLALLLLHTTHLNSLSLTGMNLSEESLDYELLERIEWSTLETLDLSGSTVPYLILKIITKKATNLKNINLSNTRITHAPETDEVVIQLPRVETLNLSGHRVLDCRHHLKSQVFPPLHFKAGEGLKRLELSDLSITKAYIKDILPCVALKELVLEQSKISIEFLTLGLIKKQNLETLDMSNATVIFEGANITRFMPLRSLKTLNLSYLNCDSSFSEYQNSLASLIRSCGRLECMALNGLSLYDTLDFLNPKAFDFLKQIQLDDAAISLNSLNNLLNAALHIQKLDLKKTNFPARRIFHDSDMRLWASRVEGIYPLRSKLNMLHDIHLNERLSKEEVISIINSVESVREFSILKKKSDINGSRVSKDISDLHKVFYDGIHFYYEGNDFCLLKILMTKIKKTKSICLNGISNRIDSLRQWLSECGAEELILKGRPTSRISSSMDNGFKNKIKRLQLENTKLQFVHLWQLLVETPELRSLTIKDTKIVGDHQTHLTPHLRELKRLYIQHSDLPYGFIYELLNAISIEVPDIHIATDDYKFFCNEKNHLMLHGLKNRLDIVGHYIRSHPNIEILTINQCNIGVEYKLDEENINEAKLRELNLHNSQLNSKFIAGLLLSANNLKSIHLNNISTNHDQVNLGDYVNARIESLGFINISHHEISFINSLISFSPKTKYLDINFASFFDETDPLIEIDGMNALEIVNFTTLSLSYVSLSNILHQSNQSLKELTLFNMNMHWLNSEEDGLSLSNLIFPSLESLSFDRCGVSTISLYYMIINAPNLKQLVIDNINIKGLFEMGLFELKPEIEAILPLSSQAYLLSLKKDKFDEKEKDKNVAVKVDVDPTVKKKRSSGLLKLKSAFTPKTKKQRSVNLNVGDKQNLDSSSKTKLNINQENTVDYDTAYSKGKRVDAKRKIYSLEEGVPHPPISLYRQKIYDDLIFNSEREGRPFILKVNSPLDLIDVDVINTKEDLMTLGKGLINEKETYHYVVDQLMVGEVWTPLTTLTPQDVISHLNAKPENIEIKYSKAFKQYYVRSKSEFTHPLSITYLLKHDRTDPPSFLPSKVKKLIIEMKSFSPGALDNVTDKTPPEIILKEMYKQRKGSCRHRVLVFKAMMKKMYPLLPVHTVSNGVHSFSEVLCRDQWVTCNLGGNDIDLNVSEDQSVINIRQKLSDEPIKKDIKKFAEVKNKEIEAQPTLDTQTDNMLIDPIHDHECFYAQQLKSQKPFIYNGDNKTFNQAMIIEKLSQYIVLKKKSKAILQDVQNGICSTLAEMFLEKNIPQWDAWAKCIHDWDGEADHLTREIASALNELYQAVKKPTHIESSFIGNNIEAFLSKHKNNMLLSNPWHRIALKYDVEMNKWIFYDPNFVNGCKVVDEKNIATVIEQSMGKLVYVEGHYPYKLESCIDKMPPFLEIGGFHVLYRALLEGKITYAFIDQTLQYTYQNLYGLYSRNTNNFPIWLLGIQTDISREFFLYYLRLLKQSKPDVFFEDVRKSLKGFSEAGKADALKQLSTYILNELPVLDEMDESTYQEYRAKKAQDEQDEYLLLKESYEHYFNAASQDEANISIENWLHLVLQGNVSKRLIEMTTTASCQHMIRLLQQEAIKNGQPYFIVDKPEDMICNAPWLQKIGMKGVLRNSPGGAFYKFIQDNKTSELPPIIIINYDHFEPNDVVSFNTIIDKIRKADGVLLPKQFKVIGVNNLSSTDVYQSADFYSRFQARGTPPNKSSDIAELLPAPILTTSNDIPEEAYHIDLFRGKDWKEQLIGYWTINGTSLLFNEGQLIKALRSQKPIVLHNPPKDKGAFDEFWADIQLKHRFEGKTVPDKIHVSEGYDFSAMLSRHRFIGVDEDTFYKPPFHPLLNVSTQLQYMNRYVCDNELNVLHPEDGHLTAHKRQYEDLDTPPPFKCQVTGFMTADQWAQILHEANRLGLTIQFELLTGVRLPDALSTFVAIEKEDARDKKDIPADVILTNDIDASCLSYLQSHNSDFHVIDVTEYKPHDILINMAANFDKETLQFSFIEEKKELVCLLEKGESIILKGPLKPALSDAILPYLRQYPSQITIITNSEDNVKSIPHQTHLVTATEKLLLLKKAYPESLIQPSLAETHSYIELDALERFNTRCQKEKLNVQTPWDPLYSLSREFNLGELNAFTYDDEIRLFNANRLKQINEAFEVSPMICLSGITGVGKTTFIQTTLSQNEAVFIGEGQLSSWVESDGGVLFIDEANINQREWSEFEGLFNIPPSIMIEGKLYPLTRNHKVIFAFNPANYGAERKINRLFKRHPNTVVFEPLTLNVIYGLSLQPLFKKTSLEDKAFAISSILLEMYKKQLLVSKEKVCLSIRDLKSITMLVITYHDLYPALDSNALTYHMVKEIAGEDALNTAQKALLKDFDIPMPLSKQSSKAEEDVFIENQSTRSITKTLSLFLDLRQYRQKSIHLSDEQLHGGLGGFILEGESGLGKSHLVLSLLENYGLTEGNNLSQEVQTNVYYHIPVTMPLVEKKKLILKAFYEGNPVIMDEINSCLMMERLLNSLLMGKSPDGQWGTKPGFFIIGTQNPIYLKGRNAISEAQSKRVIKKIYPLYTKHEMMTILLRKGLSKVQAKALVDVFMLKREKAIAAGSDTIPSFRDMMNLIGKVSEQSQQKSAIINRFINQLPEKMAFSLSLLPPDLQYETYQLCLNDPSETSAILNSAWISEKDTFQAVKIEQIIKIHTMKGAEIIKHILSIPTKHQSFYLDYAKNTPKALLNSLLNIGRLDPVLYQTILDYEPVNVYQPNRTVCLNELLERYTLKSDCEELCYRLKEIKLIGIRKEREQPMPDPCTHEDKIAGAILNPLCNS